MAWNKWTQAEQTWGAGTAVASGTQATLLPAGGQLALPANAFFAAPSPVGFSWKLHAFGIISTPASNTGTLDFRLLFGSTVVFDMGATAAITSSLSNAPWSLDINLNVKTMGAGTGTTLAGVGTLSVSSTAFTPVVVNGGSGFDCTASQYLDLQLLIGSYLSGDSVQLLGGSWTSDV